MVFKRSQRKVDLDRLEAELKEARLCIYEARAMVGRSRAGTHTHTTAKVLLKDRLERASELRKAIAKVLSCDACGRRAGVIMPDGYEQLCGRCRLDRHRANSERRKAEALAGKIPT